MTDAPTTVLVELDSRKRVALGRLAHHERYLAHEERDGTVILVPAEVLPKTEVEVLRANPGFVSELTAKMAHPERLRRRPLPPPLDAVEKPQPD
jgi:hypothetical protein